MLCDLDVDVPVKILHDPIHHRQPKAGSILAQILGGVKRFKQVAGLI